MVLSSVLGFAADSTVLSAASFVLLFVGLFPIAQKILSIPDDEWERWLAAPHREYRLVEYRGEVAGAADFEPQPGNDVEITTFGLVPEFVGKGLGGCALTLVVADAWALPGTRRVWLHTSTLDHPNALPNYLRRGFRGFSRPL